MKISVLIAAYNAGPFIHTALNSVLRQTHGEFEVIVVDDGSTDETAAVVEKFQAEDDRIIVIKRPYSEGPAAARNHAIDHATGDWLAVLDSDDSFLPDRLEEMLKIAEERQLDMICDPLELIDFDSGDSMGLACDPAWFNQTDPISLEVLLARDWPGKTRGLGIGTLKPLMLRSFVLEHHIRYEHSLRIGEDFLFYARMLLAGARFGLTDKPMYRYSIRTTSVSRLPFPTTQLVEVNQHVERYAREMGRLSTRNSNLAVLLRNREHALWFQVFTWALGVRSFGLAKEAARNMPPDYILMQLLDRCRKRFALMLLNRINLGQRNR